MMAKTKILPFLLLFLSLGMRAQEYRPANIFNLGPASGNQVLIADKSAQKIYLFQQKENNLSIFYQAPMASGRRRGDKKLQGDKKTPEGIYHFRQFFSRPQLEKKYGPHQAKEYGGGALTLNYPNVFDRRKNKSGHGIWLHATDYDNKKTGFTSQGCLVLEENYFQEIRSQVSLLTTPVVIVEKLYYQEDSSWKKHHQDLKQFFNSWMTSWRKEDLNSYLHHYAPTFQTKNHPSRKKFGQYKKRIFRRQGAPKIEHDRATILVHRNQGLIMFTQKYASQSLQDTGIKVLYLEWNKDYQWQIIREHWFKPPSLSSKIVGLSRIK